MNFYLTLKALHLIAVISWMAGLLYLPRIFVYHSENMNVKVICNVFKTMERKLYYYIMTPAMVLSWFFGFVLILIVGLENASWRFWAFKGPKLGSKKWFGNDENRKLKKRLVRKRFENLSFPINGPTTGRATRGQTSWKGGRGDG